MRTTARRVGLPLFVLLAAAGTARTAGAGAPESLRAAGAWLTQVGWDVGSACGEVAEPRQTSAGAWAEVALTGELSARLEAGGAGATGPGEDLAIGDGLAGAFVLSYRPRQGAWWVQLGAGSPAGGELSAGERELVHWLEEPALAFPVSPVTRGWRIHGGLLGGVAVRRGLALVGGVAWDQCLEQEVMPGIRLDPSARLLLQGGLVAEGERRRAELRLSAAFDGAQQLNGEEIRSRMSSWSAGVTGRTVFGPLRIGGAAAAGLSGGVRWPSAVELLAEERADQGLLGEFSFEAALDRGARVGAGWSLRPVLGAGGRRFLPDDLPLGDGWTLMIAPGLELESGPLVFAGALGWGSGGLRPWCAGSRGPRRDIEGAALRLTVAWNPAPAAAPGRAASSDRTASGGSDS